MSSFYCEICGKICLDTPEGYITGCEHYLPDIEFEVAIEKYPSLKELYTEDDN